LYEKVSDVLINNDRDRIRCYQDTTLNGLQRFVEDTLDFPPPQVFPSSLAMSLHSAFWSHVSSLHGGEPEPRAISYVLAYSVPHAPEVCLSFKTLPEEDAWSALRRFSQFRQDVESAQSRLESPLRRMKIDHMLVNLTQEAQDGVGKYAKWFYQGRIRGESVKSIAKQHKIDRSGVYYGIQQAQKFLSLAE
jgi:hypothetical protein